MARAPGRFALHDAQLTVARGYGFSGWPALVHYLAVAEELSVDPSRVDDDALTDTDRFCALSVLGYTDSDAPPRWAAAAAMLADEPGLVDRVCGRPLPLPIRPRYNVIWTTTVTCRRPTGGHSAGPR